MTTITGNQLKSMQQTAPDLLLINTLSPEHFDAMKIPGAINIPQDQDNFVARVEQRAGGKDRPIVVYCASAECDSSPQAARKLEAAGFENVFDFEGGYKEWQQQGETAAAARSSGGPQFAVPRWQQRRDVLKASLHDVLS